MNLPTIDPPPVQPIDPKNEEKEHLLNLSADELTAWLTERGHPKFRSGQILHWIFQRRVQQFSEMSDLPKALREELENHFTIYVTQSEATVTSPDGTDKLLVDYPMGEKWSACFSEMVHVVAFVSAARLAVPWDASFVPVDSMEWIGT